jgi:UTP--glucose-1-phosphate uridylyltransferase
MRKVRTAVIPVAGLGTRLLPASKSIPKEMVPVIDKPLIQYVLEEAASAGIQRVVLVTRGGKEAIEDHFSPHFELEHQLEQKGKADLLEAVCNTLPEGIELLSLRQPRAAGLGDAIRRAAPIIGDEPFAVLLPDVLISSPNEGTNDLRCMLKAFDRTDTAQILVEQVPSKDVDQYGIVDCGGAGLRPGHGAEILGMVEKPPRGSEPSRLAIVGRYVLPNRVLELLARTEPGAGGEVQLTDALHALRAESRMHAQIIRGRSFDCGNKLGYAQACFAFSLRDPSIGDCFAQFANAMLPGRTAGRLAVLREVA